MPLQRRLVTCRLHIWQLCRRDGGRVRTITSDDLDLRLWHWHTFKGQFWKGNISEVIAPRRHTVTQLGVVQRPWNDQTPILWGVVGVFANKYELDLAKVGESGLTYFSVISSGRHRNLRTAFILGRFIDLTESLHIQSFGWPSSTFVSMTYTFKENTLKPHISETITAIATLPGTVIPVARNGLKGQMEYMTLTFTKRSKRLDLLFRFPVPVRRWYRTFIFGRCDAATAMFAFWPTLTYFCQCDTHINNRLLSPSACTAVVHLRMTAAFLVFTVCVWRICSYEFYE